MSRPRYLENIGVLVQDGGSLYSACGLSGTVHPVPTLVLVRSGLVWSLRGTQAGQVRSDQIVSRKVRRYLVPPVSISKDLSCPFSTVSPRAISVTSSQSHPMAAVPDSPSGVVPATRIGKL
jgi:hypothetical protein